MGVFRPQFIDPSMGVVQAPQMQRPEWKAPERDKSGETPAWAMAALAAGAGILGNADKGWTGLGPGIMQGVNAYQDTRTANDERYEKLYDRARDEHEDTTDAFQFDYDAARDIQRDNISNQLAIRDANNGLWGTQQQVRQGDVRNGIMGQRLQHDINTAEADRDWRTTRASVEDDQWDRSFNQQGQQFNTTQSNIMARHDDDLGVRNRQTDISQAQLDARINEFDQDIKLRQQAQEYEQGKPINVAPGNTLWSPGAEAPLYTAPHRPTAATGSGVNADGVEIPEFTYKDDEGVWAGIAETLGAPSGADVKVLLSSGQLAAMEGARRMAWAETGGDAGATQAAMLEAAGLADDLYAPEDEGSLFGIGSEPAGFAPRPEGSPAATPSPNPTSPSPRIAQPQSKAEYDALPPGTVYMAPDGTQRTKGGV